MTVAGCASPSFLVGLLRQALPMVSRTDYFEFYIAFVLVPFVLCMGQHCRFGEKSENDGSPSLSSPPRQEQGKEAEKASEYQPSDTAAAPQKEQITTTDGRLLSGLFGLLPAELSAEVLACLPLSDIFFVASVDQRSQREHWDAPEVWSALARRERVSSLGSGEQQVHAEHFVELSSAAGPRAREAFRKAALRVDGSGLIALFNGNRLRAAPGDFAPIFEEASLVLRGLMPQDGKLATKGLCKLLGPALRSYDVGDCRQGEQAERLLSLARRRQDILSKGQIARLEAAGDHAAALGKLLDDISSEHEDELEAQHQDLMREALRAQGDSIWP